MGPSVAGKAGFPINVPPKKAFSNALLTSFKRQRLFLPLTEVTSYLLTHQSWGVCVNTCTALGLPGVETYVWNLRAGKVDKDCKFDILALSMYVCVCV